MMITLNQWEFNVGITCKTKVIQEESSSNSDYSGYLWQGDALPLSHFRLCNN